MFWSIRFFFATLLWHRFSCVFPRCLPAHRQVLPVESLIRRQEMDPGADPDADWSGEAVWGSQRAPAPIDCEWIKNGAITNVSMHICRYCTYSTPLSLCYCSLSVYSRGKCVKERLPVLCLRGITNYLTVCPLKFAYSRRVGKMFLRSIRLHDMKMYMQLKISI
jgi:hypothetical protein